MQHYLFTNGTHITAVTDDELPISLADDEQTVLAAATKAAVLKFEKAGLNTKAKHLNTIDTDMLIEADNEATGEKYDDASDLGVGEGAFLAAAHDLLEADDCSVDPDGVISGFNVQTWRWVSPEDIVEWLGKNPPTRQRRETPEREQAIHDKAAHNEAALRGMVEQLAQFQPIDETKDANTLDDDLAGALSQLIRRARSFMAGEGAAKATPLLDTTIRSWEIAEGSDEGFTDDQRQPWRLQITRQGDDQLSIGLWPAKGTETQADKGLQVLLEVNKGLPALHVGPNPLDNIGCHIHALNGTTLEITPDAGSPRSGTSTIYRGTRSMVYST